MTALSAKTFRTIVIVIAVIVLITICIYGTELLDLSASSESDHCSLKSQFKTIMQCDAKAYKNAIQQKPICSHAYSQNLYERLVSQTSLPKELSNKLVIIYGDSQDRNIATTFCERTKGTLTVVDHVGRIIVPTSNAAGGDCRICVVRRPQSPGEAFVLISGFHFGVAFDDSLLGPSDPGWTSHTEGLPHWQTTYNRVKMLPWILHDVAGFAFPELCEGAGVECKASPERFRIKWSQNEIESMLNESRNGNLEVEEMVKKYRLDGMILPKEDLVGDNELEKMIDANILNPNGGSPFWFPKPSLVVAQSCFWDIKNWRAQGNNDEIKLLGMVKETWSKRLKSELMGSLWKMFPDSPVVMRTTPTPNPWGDLPPAVVEAMNAAMRVFTSKNRIRLLDWADLVGKSMLSSDGYHQNAQGQEFFLDMMLSELSLWENARGECSRRPT
ncbi:hypothetical protein HDU76_012840 [Blyttiomyces sp. JEL0837]|nr:hypothetical protein HDU76_012840 [Blyttiomyces sp. JEL0837]